MKKILSIVLMITMILSATVVFTSAHTGAYDGSYGTVPATATAPVIDGAMDEAYSNSLKIPINETLGGIYNPTDPSTVASGNAYVLVSSDYQTLYVYVAVNDPDQVWATTSDLSAREDNVVTCPWMHDGVEVFLDPSNAKEVRMDVDDQGYVEPRAEDTYGLYQFRMEYNGTKSSANGNAQPRADGLNSIFEAAVQYTSASTYATEFAIDLSALSTYEGYEVGGNGADIGIMFMINDKIKTSALLNNVVSTQLIPVTGGNSPSVWSAQEWRYIVLGDENTKGDDVDLSNPAGDGVVNGVTPSGNGGSANGGSANGGSTNTATQASDGIAVAVGLLIAASAGAVVLTKKRR